MYPSIASLMFARAFFLFALGDAPRERRTSRNEHAILISLKAHPVLHSRLFQLMIRLDSIFNDLSTNGGSPSLTGDFSSRFLAGDGASLSSPFYDVCNYGEGKRKKWNEEHQGENKFKGNDSPIDVCEEEPARQTDQEPHENPDCIPHSTFGAFFNMLDDLSLPSTTIPAANSFTVERETGGRYVEWTSTYRLNVEV